MFVSKDKTQTIQELKYLVSSTLAPLPTLHLPKRLPEDEKPSMVKVY